MTYIVREPFKARSGEIRKGHVITMPEDKAQALVRAGKITELKPCHICHTFSWWLSVYGVLVCGYCHPAPLPEIVKRQIGPVQQGQRSAVESSGSMPGASQSALKALGNGFVHPLQSEGQNRASWDTGQTRRR
jgi:hypothetical protein